MFDADTIALIERAPALEGLDGAVLPRRLTEAYASIVAARMRLRQAATTPRTLPEVTTRTIGEMRRLAFTLEALVSALPERDNRAAAAFVAGTAHHITLLAERFLAPTPRPSALGLRGIAPEVSATLLFLIAEATADAAEMSKAIVVRTDNAVEAALLEAVRHLANGRLPQLLEAEVPPSDSFLRTQGFSQGIGSLYYMLLHGVRGMAAVMIGRDTRGATGPFTAEPRALFEEVKALCVDPIDDLFDAATKTAASSVFPGPFHTASLLSAVSRDLTASALANLPPPADIDEDRWSGTMREIARRRPYLWRNHRQAIVAGYLERGVSSVISFPTGAGKSALAELKIAASLLRGEKVVFLAPTLALVDQTAKVLTKTFPKAAVRRDLAEEALLALGAEEIPAISVLTPERCLTLLSFNRDVFDGVGLIVFDECHLLHPRAPTSSRRAVDAMLCVLNLAAVAPGADLLFLSAMLKNASQIAAWIQHLTERVCLPLELTWKPTRQVRGCAVYATDEIGQLRARLRDVRRQVKTKNAPAALKRDLMVRPFGLFCLRQTWHMEREDYALLPLLDTSVALATGTARDQSWYLTPNGNEVAASIAVATGAQCLKTLVFTQTIQLANAAAKSVAKQLDRSGFTLTREESELYAAARDEVGGDVHLYLEVGEHDVVTSAAAAHHGLLLPEERTLHESLFRRPDGINVLVATSTLAQGMNLPSEVVIIAGDRRFDQNADRMEQLEAHELLNAAGRAGRAGESSYGFVLVVPSKIVHFDNATSRVGSHWAELRTVFSQSDQCIVVEDPLTPLLDQIHAAAEPLSEMEMAQYLIRRLPLGGFDDEEGFEMPARNLLNKSLGAFFARARGDDEWVESRVEAALAARRADPDVGKVMTWAGQLAAAAGVPVALIRDLGDWLRARPAAENAPISEWRDALFDWLEQRPALIPFLLRREGLEGLLGARYRQLGGDEERGRLALPVLRTLLRGWMAGSSLADLERSFGTPRRKLGKCKAAREFVLRVVPELAYLFGLVSQVGRALAAEPDTPRNHSTTLEILGSCVRDGIDRPEKLALRMIRGKRLSNRVAVHREFALLEGLLDSPPEHEELAGLVQRVRNAVDAFERNDESS